MLGGTKGNWDVFVWAVLGLGRFLVLVSCQCYVNVTWHADVARVFVVVPFDGHATGKGARPIKGDFIPLL